MSSEVLRVRLTHWSESSLKVSPTRRPLILCIDDDAAGLRPRKEVFEFNGFDVRTAMAPVEGLKLFLVEDVSLVIADHLLQGASGLVLASQMKRAKANVPIIILSGGPPSEFKHVDCYINKGEPIAEVLRICRNLVERAEN